MTTSKLSGNKERDSQSCSCNQDASRKDGRET